MLRLPMVQPAVNCFCALVSAACKLQTVVQPDSKARRALGTRRAQQGSPQQQLRVYWVDCFPSNHCARDVMRRCHHPPSAACGNACQSRPSRATALQLSVLAQQVPAVHRVVIVTPCMLPFASCSVDLVQCAGFEGAPCSLNEDLVSAVQVLAAAMRKWGVMPTLDFVRGGRTGAPFACQALDAGSLCGSTFCPRPVPAVGVLDESSLRIGCEARVKAFRPGRRLQSTSGLTTHR